MPQPFPRDATEFCITDVGSTTTKVILFRREGGAWRFHRREAATTVEKPQEDVTLGVRQALRALEAEARTTLLADDAPALPYLSTSSAGGGLAMVVTGLVREVTSRSAERVALGAGAILLDVIAMNDGRTTYEKIEALKTLRPDMVLLAGGFDGDAISGPVFLAELVRESALRPKLSPSAPLPVIYAGNTRAHRYIADTLAEGFLVRAVPNIRPTSTRENLDPAREAIDDLFMGHVMSQAPGYDRLVTWVSAPIMPTPLAFGKILSLASRRLGARVLAIDIGGATTDVFTVEGDRVIRTVSANLGMSYSILNVARQAGIPALAEVLDADLSSQELWDRIGNKLLRPTRLPHTPEEMKVEWAVGTVAIREAVKDHLRVLAGWSPSRGKEDLAITGLITSRDRRKEPAPDRLHLCGYDLVIGSGGILSHSPRAAAAMMLIDALQPAEPVDLAVDSAFMFPHLGALSEVHPDLALQLFEELGLVRLGSVVRAQGTGERGGTAIRLRGDGLDESVAWGELRAIPLGDGRSARVKLSGSGSPRLRERGPVRLSGGTCGLILDARAGLADAPRGAAALLTEFSIPAAGTADEAPGGETPGGEVRRGTITLRRELAIPGEVLVRPGEIVAPDTVIARSTRQFLRPFFLEPLQSLKVEPQELPNHLLKHVGDTVSTGELIARRRVGILDTREFRSPVDGTLERILPTGAIVVRERPEDAAQLTTVQVARELHVFPHQIRRHVRVTVGQPVERGQRLAVRGDPGPGAIQCVSPVRGRIKDIHLEYGIITIEPLLEELDVRAWMPGRVTETSDRGCRVENQGIDMNGAWGQGGEVAGRLTFGGEDADAIRVVDIASREILEALARGESRGLLAGGAHLEDVLDIRPAGTIVLTEGFGMRPIRAEIRELLREHEGRLILLDGTTEMRVGVRRPRILLPDGTRIEAARQARHAL